MVIFSQTPPTRRNRQCLWLTLRPLQNIVHTGSAKSPPAFKSLPSLFFLHSKAIRNSPEDISRTSEWVGIANSSNKRGALLESPCTQNVTLPFLHTNPSLRLSLPFLSLQLLLRKQRGMPTRTNKQCVFSFSSCLPLTIESAGNSGAEERLRRFSFFLDFVVIADTSDSRSSAMMISSGLPVTAEEDKKKVAQWGPVAYVLVAFHSCRRVHEVEMRAGLCRQVTCIHRHRYKQLLESACLPESFLFSSLPLYPPPPPALPDMIASSQAWLKAANLSSQLHHRKSGQLSSTQVMVHELIHTSHSQRKRKSGRNYSCPPFFPCNFAQQKQQVLTTEETNPEGKLEQRWGGSRTKSKNNNNKNFNRKPKQKKFKQVKSARLWQRQKRYQERRGAQQRQRAEQGPCVKKEGRRRERERRGGGRAGGMGLRTLIWD